MKNLVFLFAIIGLCGLTACSDVVIDADLLTADAANIQFKDDFSVVAKTIVEDSIGVYTPATEYSKYPCGTFNDPVFGKVSTSIFGQLRLISPTYPDFPAGTLDSIVLSLVYADDGIYGNSNEEYGLEVYRVEEDMNRDSTYASNVSFDVDMNDIGSVNFIPKPQDSVYINRYGDGFVADSLYESPPQLRLPLKYFFGNELYELDSTHYENIVATETEPATIANEELLIDFKGIEIRPSTENGGMLAFNLLSSDSRLTMYYKDGAELKEFSFYFTDFSVKTLHITHDYAGAPVETFLADESMGDSLLFTQGLAGPFIQLDFPGLKDLQTSDQRVLVNKAELEFYVADIDNAGAAFDPVEQLIIFEPVESTSSRTLVEDAFLGVVRSALDEFGGVVRTESPGVQKYTMNISGHVQEMINGTASETLFIEGYPKPTDFSRVVLYGANHSTYPLKLKLTYTQF